MSNNVNRESIKQLAGEVEFDLVGVAAAGVIEGGERLRDYLERGYQGEMGYLAENVERRIDVGRLIVGAKSVICVGLNYYGPEPSKKSAAPCGKVARYGRGRDYHEVVKKRLYELADRIREAVGGAVRLRCFVDTAPLLEKALAARAGLGWIGKNGLLINEQFGSWVVLGEIVTDLVLEYDEPIADKCGDCELCLEACPTRALVRPYILEARRCVSYLTIESKRDIPEELGAKLGDSLFGCDRCQEVCPYNKKVVATRLPELQPRAKWSYPVLDEILALERRGFEERFAGSCIRRAGWEHLRDTARWCKRNMGGEL